MATDNSEAFPFASGASFLHGLSVGSDLWLYEQPSEYYRRHLLLHEGTHAFMGKFLGGCGPGWYMEGMAELFGTHRLRAEGGGRQAESQTGPEAVGTMLETRIMPRSRDEVPMWGRVKLIREAIAAGRAKDLPAVMALDNTTQMDDESYAWCWAATKFLDSDPKYRDRFRRLKARVRDRDFNEIVKREFGDGWPNVELAWEAFITALDYGYDFERTAIEFERGTALVGKPRAVTVAADRGWQSSGVWLDAGRKYRVSANGRYQIAVEKTKDGEVAWPCEPGGVTIEYHDGRPLGVLLGAIVARPAEASLANVERQILGDAGFGMPIAIGLGTTITPAANGTLYLRVNDSAAHLDDNRGSLTVTIED
jgi:hypothetical protein